MSCDSSLLEILDFSNFSYYKIYSLVLSKNNSKIAHNSEKIQTNTLVNKGYVMLPV